MLDWRLSTADFRAHHAGTRSMDNLAAWGIARSTNRTDGPTQWLIMRSPATSSLYTAYGLERPRLGRLFRLEECAKPGNHPVVVLSEELWRSRFQADPRI